MKQAQPGGDGGGLQLIVGIGSSAGGIPALRRLLALLPLQAPVAYVLLQHTDAARVEELCRVLSAEGRVPIQVARNGQALHAGQLYLVPPDQECAFDKGSIQLQTAPTRHGAPHSIDRMLTALADAYEDRSVGVVLSGTGMDGVTGMRAVRSAGGVTIAQDPAGAEYPSMPEAVIGAGLADLILTPEEIAGEVQRLLEWQGLRPDARAESEAEALEPVLRLIQRRTGLDFQRYKEGTVRRRLERRMMLNRCATLDLYRRLLVRSEDEAEQLVRDLLISVTSFFRDANTFETLGELLQPMVDQRGAGDAIRAWVPGCATGEEAYSVAMVLAELLGERIGRIKVQIFATDIDAAAIREARQAAYSPDGLRALPDGFVEKYFEPWDGLYRLRRELRDMVVFAEHDLARDPPFTKLDLISCRNLLIYFKPALQEQIYNTFHYGLKPSGLLLLGSSESADRRSELFARADKRIKIYRRLEFEGVRPTPTYRRPVRQLATPAETVQEPAPSSEQRVQRILVDAYAPPCALVNTQHNIVYVRGDITPYVRLPQGEVNVNLLDMAVTAELRVELRLVLSRALRDGRRANSYPLTLPDSDPPCQLTLTGLPGDDGFVLVVFEAREVPQGAADRGDTDDADKAQRILELEKELADTREHLQDNIEELEAANEELQSTNEEFQSTTEELQSALEEHQTTNEELQSTNEELSTVNDELHVKSEALEATNTDMQSILENVAAAIIVLDRDLCIARYSAASKALFDLWPSMIGRPFLNIGGDVDLSLLTRDLRQAVRSRAPSEAEVTIGGNPYSVRITPRFDQSGNLSSLVIVFSEESERLRARKNVQLLAAVVRDANDAIFVRDMAGRIMSWNAAAERMFGRAESEAVGASVDTVIPEALRPHVQALEAPLRAGRSAPSEEALLTDAELGRRAVTLTSSALVDDGDRPFAISTIVRDTTRQHEEREAIRVAKEATEHNMRANNRFLAAASHDLRQPLQSLAYYLSSAESAGDDELRRTLHHKMGLSLGAMRHLLNSLLDISRLDSGEIAPRLVDLPIQRVLDEVCAQAAAEEASDRSVQLRCAPCSAYVRSDHGLLIDMLGNLIFNAVKYTRHGRVLVGCRRRGAELRIDVIDSGPGIAPEDQQEIFEDFVRLPAARDSEEPGLGLGLSIVRRLSALLEHPIELHSVLGRGTRVSITLPRVAEPTTAVMEAAPSQDERTGHVLLVEDDDAVRDASAQVLTAKGFTVTATAGGDEALRLAQSTPPDVVMVDYRLGAQDGLQVLQRLRDALQQPALPAIVISGDSGTDLEAQTEQAGARRLLKPVDIDELLSLLRELLAETDRSGQPA